MVDLRLNEAKSELEPVRDIQFLGLQLHLDQGRAEGSIQSSGDNGTHVPNILPENLVVHRSPCCPTQAVAGPIVSHIRNPYPAFPGGVHHFHRYLDPGLRCPHGGFSNCGCMDPFRTRAPHQWSSGR